MPDIEWVIRWVQDISLVGIIYKQRHGSRVPNPPPNKYAPVQYSDDIKGETEKKKMMTITLREMMMRRRSLSEPLIQRRCLSHNAPQRLESFHNLVQLSI
ncbi:hypothetical protein PVK06_020660 [Gossypium arboreum]|uniref:Uncharacterized protein n=1 Tax=Gossypium arboreum TaxID=29729 RepID=A0ABR0PN95_GOSAR|nr:hypothetical protein PVK06_020660 [Gossypium arboreum]